MMNFIPLLKNKMDRILLKKEIFVIAIIIIPIMIFTAVLLSGRESMKTKIALITEDVASIDVQSFPENDKFDIKVMSKKPEVSDLLFGYYDATVEKNNGEYIVTTVIKSKSDKQIIEDFFNKGKSPDNYESQERERGLGTKVLGFILMIVLMQGVALTILYPEDKTLKTFGRILTAPVSENQYIFAQGVFTFLWVYIPTYLAVVITKECFSVNMGFSLGMLALLVGILSLLSTGFGLFISSVLKQNITLTASGIAIVTSLLAGCMVSFSAANKVLNILLGIIPQKAFMTMSDGIEKGKSILEFPGELIYLFIWVFALWLFGSYIIKGKVKKGIY